MESIILFNDNALIYSPNLFFITVLLFFCFTLLLILNTIPLIIKSILYVIDVKKKRKKPKNNKAKFIIKKVIKIYEILSKERITILLYLARLLKKIKKEILIESKNKV